MIAYIQPFQVNVVGISMPAAISEQEYKKRILDISSGKYELVGFAEPFRGTYTKCHCRCLVDGNEWKTTTIKQLIRGNGCPLCGGVKRWSANDYADKINIVGADRHVFIDWPFGFKNKASLARCSCLSCNGEFSSRLDNLINRKTSCPSCQRAAASSKCSKTKMKKIDMVINDVACAIGDEIELIGVVGEVKGTRTVMRFRCEDHSIEFDISANHVVCHGQRCPLCNLGGFNMAAAGFLYAIKSDCGRYVKVGITNSPKDRFSQLKRSTPFSFNIEHIVRFDVGRDARRKEKKIHDKFKSADFTGFDGATEWLEFDEEIINEMNRGA